MCRSWQHCGADLNIKIVLLDNGGLGLVRQQQELFHSAAAGRLALSGRPSDFLAIALHSASRRWSCSQMAIHCIGVLSDCSAERAGPALVRVPTATASCAADGRNQERPTPKRWTMPLA